MDADDAACMRLGEQNRHLMAVFVGGIVGAAVLGGAVGWVVGWFYPLH